MVVNGRPLKRLKRRVTADLNDFLTFPAADAVSPVIQSAEGPFRTCVKAFLAKHALLPLPSSLFPHLLMWQILFRVGDFTYKNSNGSSPEVVCVDVVEEDVSRSRYIYCDQCRVVGWSNNPVCSKRYHFIIKADGNSIAGYNKSCPSCRDVHHLSEPRCKSCNHVMTIEDVEEWIYHQLDDTTHLLHGVIHANGFGHLLRVNGRESGSRLLSGRHIMNFWDRLCKILGARNISVTDVSKKYGLDFRLLHAITNGRPWYGDWGYEFGAGSFGLTCEAYKLAVENLSSLPLSAFLSQGREPHTHIQHLILFYQSLSERELVNIRDLFTFLMNLIHDMHKSPLRIDDSVQKKHQTRNSRALRAWNSSDISRVEAAMIRVLTAVTRTNWVSWRALRGAVCKLGTPELLDYCLKELKGKKAIDGMIVNARCNPDSGAMEYRLEPGTVSVTVNKTNQLSAPSNYPSEVHLLQDLRYLYEAMLCPLTMSAYVPPVKRDVAIRSATIILDCKQFVKDYQPEKFLRMSKPHAIQLLCEVDLVEQSHAQALNPPPELLILCADATISDLKEVASKTFQDVYLILRRFRADELVGYGGVRDTTQVKLLLGSQEYVRVRGKCLGKSGLSRFRRERGLERWTVDCSCGAQDDDGERMMACDACGVWQHTRCAGTLDSQAVPLKFFCNRCKYGSQTMQTNQALQITGSCMDGKTVASVASSGGLGKGLVNIV